MGLYTTFGPTDTEVAGVAAVTLAVTPLNFEEDWRVVEASSDGSKIVYANVTTPVDMPATLRIAQSLRPNVYAGTSIEPANMSQTRKGLDIVFEIKEVIAVKSDEDAAYRELLPVRAAITFNVPVSAHIGATEVERLIARSIAAIAEQGSASITSGLNLALHGVTEKR